MDAERYARVRELFLAVEELPQADQHAYLISECGEDHALRDEVLSLLSEHDAESAQIEGESAKKPAVPSGSPQSDSASMVSPFLPDTRGKTAGDSSTSDLEGHLQRKREREQQRRGDGSRSAQVTQHSAQRTHAAPRYGEQPRRKPPKPSAEQLHGGAKSRRRRQLAWLGLAALIPSVLIGWNTYSKVDESARVAVANELTGIADSLTQGVDEYLNDQADLVASWSRSPALRTAILALIESSGQTDSVQSLRSSPHAADIRKELRNLAQNDQVKYVVWDRTGRVVASWLDGGEDIGSLIAPDGAGNLARVMRGERVLYGPAILREESIGFPPDTTDPVMAELVPIRNRDDEVVATLLVRGLGLFNRFDALIRQAAQTPGVDVYAVNRSGTMISNSALAQSLVSGGSVIGEQIACRFRVADPSSNGQGIAVQSQYSSQPLTYSVAGASSGHSGQRMISYPNYAGQPVVGVWRWIDQWGIGIVAERTSRTAFTAPRWVALGLLSLGGLLSIVAVVATRQIVKQSVLDQEAIHPLSRYEVLAELGSGGMGVVYRAKHKQLGRENALKVLRSDRDNLEDRMRFDREAKLAASLSNPHTVTVYDYGRGVEGEAYCVMEFLKGITLYDVVARSGCQAYGRVFFILRQICDSLGEAHHLGLVHRDMKPQNVMLSLDPSVGDWAVVFDFGLAKPLIPDADSYQTAETIWAGTPMYMAPERYRDPNAIDPRSDIYSVGCIAYFLLTGRPPFIECDPESLFALVLTEQPISLEVHRDEEVPEEIEALVKRCMAKNAADRFSTVDELAAALDGLINQYPWAVDDARSWWRIHGDDDDR